MKPYAVLGIVFKIMNNKEPFPWHFYIGAVRAKVTIIIVACILTYISDRLAPDSSLTRIIFVVLGMSLFVFLQEYFKIGPIKRSLGRIDTIQDQLPHEKKLDLIYQKDEFQLIEEMLGLTEKHLKEQKENFENQIIQSNTLLNSIPSPIVIIDKYENLKQYNKSFSETFIKDRDVQIVNSEKLWKIFDQEKIYQAFHSATEGKEVKIKAMYFESSNQYFDFAVTPVENVQGETRGALGIFHEVTQAKLNEKMRVDFVANVSHEVRTPLTSIKGYSQLLKAQKSQIPAQLSPVLEKIDSNTERLKDLFDNLLKLSVIESKQELIKESFDLNSMIKSIAADMKGKYLHKDFKIQLNQEIQLYGDGQLFQQVFSNLVDNAIKYSDKEEVLISIEKEESPTEINIVVKDNGPGFAAMEQNRIFERFYRVQGNADKAIEGAGLGLSIVKHIVQKHQGSIKATSARGIGSTFTISLPKLEKC